MKLTKEQLKTLNRDGFLKLPQLTASNEALYIRGTLERLFTRKAGEKEGAYGELAAGTTEKRPNSPQIVLPVNYAPDLHQTTCFSNALQLARQILGPEARFVKDISILKRADDGSPTPWHQDVAFHDPQYLYKEVTIWVALQDVDEASGCLKFVPGSHHGRILEHERPRTDANSVALECVGDFDRSAAVPGEIPLGGCTIHFPQTLHCSTPNSSGASRIAYIMTFGTTPTPAEKPISFAWRESNTSSVKAIRRRWMMRGGVFVVAWRRIRRGELRDRTMFAYWLTRATQTVLRGS